MSDSEKAVPSDHILGGWKLPEQTKFVIQYVVMPVVMLLAGYALNGRINQQEIELKRAEMISNLSDKLFSTDINPSQAIVQAQLIIDVMDEDSAILIKKSVVKHFEGKFRISKKGNLIFTNEKIETIQGISNDSKSSRTDIALELRKNIEKQRFYLIVASLLDQAAAIEKARSLRAAGYDSEVHFSITGYYGVTIGYSDVISARELFERARAEGKAPKDAYLHDGTRFTKKVYPE